MNEWMNEALYSNEPLVTQPQEQNGIVTHGMCAFVFVVESNNLELKIDVKDIMRN